MSKLILLLAWYVQLALGLSVTPIEFLARPWLRHAMGLRTKPLSGSPRQFGGATTLNSGTGFVTISTAVINSDSLLNVTFAPAASIASGTNITIMPSSIVSGISFALGHADAQGRAPTGTLMWEIRRTS